MGNLPERTCIGCNSKKNKKDLIRIVKNKNGEINLDLKGNLEGRGTYICKNEECLDKIIKNRKLVKNFNVNIDDNVYESLREIINGGEVI